MVAAKFMTAHSRNNIAVIQIKTSLFGNIDFFLFMLYTLTPTLGNAWYFNVTFLYTNLDNNDSKM